MRKDTTKKCGEECDHACYPIFKAHQYFKFTSKFKLGNVPFHSFTPMVQSVLDFAFLCKVSSHPLILADAVEPNPIGEALL